LHKSLHRGLGVNIIMLDNMSPGDIAKVYEELVRKGLRGRVVLGASGRINEDNVMEYARYVDVVSIGALTHSYKSINMSMDLIRRISNTIYYFVTTHSNGYSVRILTQTLRRLKGEISPSLNTSSFDELLCL